jgi:hypothetical protein
MLAEQPNIQKLSYPNLALLWDKVDIQLEDKEM